jgi:hypothetical protein
MLLFFVRGILSKDNERVKPKSMSISASMFKKRSSEWGSSRSGGVSEYQVLVPGELHGL